MFRSAVFCLALGLSQLPVWAEEPKLTTRPITEAESVMAVYREHWGLGSHGTPAIILAAWPDGHIVWSGNRLEGGAPYRAGRADPKKVTALLEQFDKDGLFADDKLNQAHFGPDSQFTMVFLKSGKKKVAMASWHELMEESVGLVCDHFGAHMVKDQRRLDVLRKAKPEYLFFRFVWSETRGKLNDLIPSESSPSAGKPFKKAGVLSWQEPAGR